METALSTHLFVQHRLTTVWLDKVLDAGFPAVEIFCAKQHFDYYNRAQINELKHWFLDSRLQLHSLHSPIYNDEVWGRSGPQAVVNIAERAKPKRIAHVDEIKRALELAEVVPCRYLIQHLGHQETEYDEWQMEAAFSSLEEIRLFAKARGVDVLLENIPNVFSSAERLVMFLQQTHLDLGFVLDTGHANLHEGFAEAYSIMQGRLRSTHVHDNDGKSDQHLFPLVSEGGTIDWRRAMQRLRSRPGQYPLLLELKEPPDMEFPLEKAREACDRLLELRDPDEEEEY